MRQFIETMTLVIAAAGLVLTPAVLRAGDMSNQASQKLAQAESLARSVRHNAGITQTFVRHATLFTKSSHARTLSAIKEDSNKLGDVIASLHKSRGEMEDWQAQLVTRLLPRMESLAADVGSAIRFIDENPQEDFTPMYEDYVDGIYNQSNSIVTSIDRYLDWAEAKRAKEALQASVK